MNGRCSFSLSRTGLFYFLGSIVNFSQDADVHFKYIQVRRPPVITTRTVVTVVDGRGWPRVAYPVHDALLFKFSGRASFWGDAYTVRKFAKYAKFAYQTSEVRTNEKK